MKNIKILLTLFTIILFFAACEKDEITKNYDSISGILSAGENVSAEDLIGLEIYLGRFHDSIDFANITLKTTAIDSVAATTLNADGSFSFDKLAPGNYGLVMKNGFIFSVDTALTINLDGNSESFIQKEIDRLPEENFMIVPPSQLNQQGDSIIYSVLMINLKKMNLLPNYQVKNIHCYFNSELHPEPYVVNDIENELYVQQIYVWHFQNPDDTYTTYHIPYPSNVEIEFEIWAYDNAGNVSDKFNSRRVPYYYFQDNEMPSNSWLGEKIDIEMVAYSEIETGWWIFKNTIEIPPHYLIRKHN